MKSNHAPRRFAHFTGKMGLVCLQSMSLPFFFNDTATTEIYTLSLHDALPIRTKSLYITGWRFTPKPSATNFSSRSEEHTSELQSRGHLVCRLLLEKKQTALGIAGSAKTANCCRACFATSEKMPRNG